MSKEVVVPKRMLLDGIDYLNPNKFPFENEGLSEKENALLETDRNKLLDTYTQIHKDASIQAKIFEITPQLIKDRRFREETGGYGNDSRRVLLMIVQNQTKNTLQDNWEAMLDGLQLDTNSLDHTLTSIGNPTYGLYGLAFMPDDEGNRRPPLETLPEAFTRWIKTIDKKDQSNQILIFFSKFSDFYTPEDAFKLTKKINSYVLEEFNNHLSIIFKNLGKAKDSKKVFVGMQPVLKHTQQLEWAQKSLETLPLEFKARAFVGWANQITPQPEKPNNKPRLVEDTDFWKLFDYITENFTPKEMPKLQKTLDDHSLPLWAQEKLQRFIS